MRRRLCQITTLLLATICSSACLATTLYKYIDAQGNVAYSDSKPADHNAKLIHVPEIQTYEAQMIPAAKDSNAENTTAPALQENMINYQTFQITTPSVQQHFHNQAIITVKIEIAPALAQDHKIQVFLDGKAIGKATTTTEVDLVNVERGEHSVYASIYSAEANVLKTTPSVLFYVHRHSAIKQGPRRSPIP